MIFNTLKKLATWKILAILWIISVLPFVLVKAFHPWMYTVLEIKSYLAFHNFAEFFSVMVALSMFSVGWYSYQQSQNSFSLFMGCAFLTIGAIDFMHALSYPGMPDFITPNSANKSTQLWIVTRGYFAIALIVSYYSQRKEPRRIIARYKMLAGSVLFPFLIFVGVVFFPGYLPATFSEDTGLTAFKVISEYCIIILLFFSLYLYQRQYAKRANKVILYLMVAIIFSIYSELSFTRYKSAFDTYNMLGHIYKIFAFIFIYLGVFRGSVKEPYIRLKNKSYELENEIVERLQVEKEKLEGEVEYKNLIDTAVDAIIVSDEDGKINLVNSAAVRMFGYNNPNEMIRIQASELYADPAQREFLFRELNKEGFVIEYELNMKRKDGSTFIALDNAVIQRDTQGKIISTQGIIRDITEQRVAEKITTELQRRNTQILNAAGEGIYGLDLEGKTTFANPSAAKMIGWEPRDLIGKYQHDILHHSKSNGSPYPKEECPIYAAFIDGKDHLVEDEVFWRKDGTSFPVRYHSAPVRDDNGEITGAVVTFNDITKKLEIEASREKALEEARHANRVKSLFIANMSHEIRTPLNAILGYTDLIEEETVHLIGENGKEFFKAVKSGGYRLMRTIHSILDLSQIDAGAYQPKAIDIDLEKFVGGFVRELNPSAISKNIELSYSVHTNSTSIHCDQYAIERIVSNIIDNAIKYTEQGTVEVSLNERDGKLIMIISDTGIGMEKEYVSNLFDTFSQESVGYSKNYQGIGLGMSLVKRYTDYNNIDIEIQSEKNVGSTFTLIFPDEIRIWSKDQD